MYRSGGDAILQSTVSAAGKAAALRLRLWGVNPRLVVCDAPHRWRCRPALSFSLPFRHTPCVISLYLLGSYSSFHFSPRARCASAMRKQRVVNASPQSSAYNNGRFECNDRRGRPYGNPTATVTGRRGHTGARPPRSCSTHDGTIPAAFISPFQASRPQCGQHSASVVRTCVSGPSQEQMLFYSSVQRRGGAFTKTAQETTVQLARTGVLPNSIAYQKRARAALENIVGRPQSAQERFASMQSNKEQAEVRQATALVKKTATNRFAVENSDSEGDDDAL